MLRPPALVPGSRIRLIATARCVEEALVLETEHRLSSTGFIVQRGDHLLARHFQLAGEDAMRKSDLQEALNDPTVAAVFIMRGGYGSHRILDNIDLRGFRAAPKWVVGFSDVTALHGLLQRNRITSLHAAMPSTYPQTSKGAIDEIIAVLRSGKGVDQQSGHQPLSIVGEAAGRLVGGNLSVLNSILGTDCFPIQQGDILMLEDVDEMLYHLDRMMLQLLRAGELAKLAGLVVGGMSSMRDNTMEHGFKVDNPFGMNGEQIILHYCKELGIPVMLGAQVGHIAENRPMILGDRVKLEVRSDKAELTYL